MGKVGKADDNKTKAKRESGKALIMHSACSLPGSYRLRRANGAGYNGNHTGDGSAGRGDDGRDTGRAG